MKYYALKLVKWYGDLIDPFIFRMFHGIAFRESKVAPHHEYYDRDSKLLFPLDIERNGFLIPDITRPAENLVVSQSVKKRLDGLPGIAFFRVRFIKLFHYPWKLGDRRHLDFPYEVQIMTTEDYYATLDDVPAYHRGLAPYYELLVASPPALRKLDAFLEPKKVLKAEFPFSARMLEENTILISEDGSGCGYCLTEPAFEAMAPFLDPNFFEWEIRTDSRDSHQ